MVYADPVFGTYDRFDFIISSEREKTIGLVAYHPLKRIHSLAIHSWFLISLSLSLSLRRLFVTLLSITFICLRQPVFQCDTPRNCSYSFSSGTVLDTCPVTKAQSSSFFSGFRSTIAWSSSGLYPRRLCKSQTKR